MIITIDGPVASGKSSVARALAKELKLYFLATGMLYRTIAYALINDRRYTKKDLEHPKEDDLLAVLDPKRFQYFYCPHKGAQIFFDSKDITPFLKTSDMDQAASILSADALVREVLLSWQRSFGKTFNLIAEGRDVGSVVFPDAEYKFFLTASVQVRAKRWQADQRQKLVLNGVEGNNNFSLQEAMEKITERDQRDRNRTMAPLIKPSGAIVIDNSELDFQQTLQRFIEVIEVSSISHR